MPHHVTMFLRLSTAGFPFFAPLFIPGSKWNIHAPGGFSSTLEDKLSSQMSHEFFPLTIDQFGADINYHDLKEGELHFGDIRVTTQYINHTVLTLGYRLEAKDGTSIGYITDHEPFDHRLATEGYTRKCTDKAGCALKTPDDRHADFLKGLDLLIHDTQYLAKEYPKHEGWGHSTVEYVVDIAMSVGVKQLALFHHDPQRKDTQVDEMVHMAQNRVKQAGGTLKVFAAADNMSIDLKSDSSEPFNHTPSNGLTKPRVLLAQPQRETVSALTSCQGMTKDIMVSLETATVSFKDLESDGFCVSGPEEGKSLLESAQKAKPSLLLASHCPANDCMLTTCKAIREDSGAWGKEVPFLIVAKDHGEVEAMREQGAAVGVTDWVVEPFSQAYIRTRIRMAISRSPCKWVPPVIPKNEKSRQAALLSLDVLDSPMEERFDRITRTCATVFDVPLVFISLVDQNRQWFKSATWLCPGTAPAETSREISFCGHTINQNGIFIVPDATQDPRFAHNPLVDDVGGLQMRFYAGYPLSIRNIHGDNESEFNIGTLCLIDKRPRDLDDMQIILLRDFSAMVVQELLRVADFSLARQMKLARAAAKQSTATSA
jgi:GAF domain-containing protein/phosphoribosyl 1,2-cyclic phosphodiesterase